MRKSNDMSTNIFLRLLGDAKTRSLAEYSKAISGSTFKEFTTKEETATFFQEQIAQTNSLPENRALCLREYTGFRHKTINPLLRGFWSYENAGKRTKELESQVWNTTYNVDKILKDSLPLAENITTFRGVDISAFARFGITSLSELGNLKDNFVCERGFLSTSLTKDSSFFNKESAPNNQRNILIQYLIPEGFSEGRPLLSDNVTYYDNEIEYLIGRGSLSYVTDVAIDENNNTAMLTQVLIPSQLYEQNNNQTMQSENTAPQEQ